MSDVRIMKAVEFDKLSAAFKKRYRDIGMLVNAGWLVQKKYDGCFGMATIRSIGDSEMHSRTGELVRSCDHILQEIEEAAVETMGADHDDLVVLGEVWHPTLSFPTISGKFRQHKAADDLHFVSNDLLSPGLNTNTPYWERLQKLSVLLPPIPNSSFQVTIAETYSQYAGNPMEAAMRWVAEGGFDGAILRDPNAGYKIGLVKNGEIVKVKPQMTLDLAVTSIGVAEGEKTGRNVYTLTVCYRGVTTRVGSGVPHQAGDVPVVGQIVEIGCLGVTEDGKLREPRFLRCRFDKETQDT